MDAKNVLGGQLLACSYDPVTGYFRDGCCNTDSTDRGNHTICVRVTGQFLDFSRAQGNDLAAGMAPPVVLEATHERALGVVPLEILMEYAWEPGATRG